jgi:hypothetical protein
MRTLVTWTAPILLMLPAASHAGLLAAAVTHQQKPAVIRVSIDVKPGDKPTTLEPKREGMVPIAILSTKDFDAAQVDPDTVRAGATGSEASVFKSMMEDVDNDKDVDLLLLFRVPQLALSCNVKSVTVRGKTETGQDFEGTETVTMVGCER